MFTVCSIFQGYFHWNVWLHPPGFFQEIHNIYILFDEVLNWYTRGKPIYIGCNWTSIYLRSKGAQYFISNKTVVNVNTRILYEDISYIITLFPLKRMHGLLKHHIYLVGSFYTINGRNWITIVSVYVCVSPETIFISNHKYFTTPDDPLLTRNMTSESTASLPITAVAPSVFITTLIDFYLLSYLVQVGYYHIINYFMRVPWVVPTLYPLGVLVLIAYLDNYFYLQPSTVQHTAEVGLIASSRIHIPRVHCTVA